MIRINKNSTMVFLLLFFSMRWEINDYIGNNITQFIENSLRVFAAMYSAFLYMKNRKEDRKSSLVFLILTLMQGWLLLSTYFNQGVLINCFTGYLCPIVVIGLLFESMVNDPKDIIQGSMRMAEVLTYTNLLTIILFPDGMYSTYRKSAVWYSNQNWILGNRNDFIPLFVYFALIAFLYRCHGGKRWRELGVYVACLASVIIVNSSTSIVGFISLLVLFLIIKSEKIRINTYLLVFVNITLFLAIVVFRLQNVFSFLIEDILGKNLTFTGRTILWDKLIPILKNNWLLGLGIREVGGLQEVVGIKFAGHAHNLILNLLYRGGVIYLGLYLAAMFLIYRQLHKYQSYMESQAVAVAMFVFHIIALMEPYEKTFFVYAIYFMAYYVGRFIPQAKSDITLPEQRERTRVRITTL